METVGGFHWINCPRSIERWSNKPPIAHPFRVDWNLKPFNWIENTREQSLNSIVNQLCSPALAANGKKTSIHFSIQFNYETLSRHETKSITCDKWRQPERWAATTRTMKMMVTTMINGTNMWPQQKTFPPLSISTLRRLSIPLAIVWWRPLSH